MHVDSSTRAIQFASYTYDVSVEEIFTVLQLGGTVCVPSDSERLDDINAAIARYGATWGDLTPTVVALIKPDLVPSLKTICLGGEAVRQDVVDTWAGKVDLINGYGPAEASVTCVCSEDDLGGTIEAANIGAGVGCRTWVVDPADYNRLAPVGAIGELLIEGPILARCYLKDPQKTAASFVENPEWAFGDKPMRLYRTRDLVRYTSEGTLVFIGRADSQIKIRGQRVELNDIEWNITRQSQVQNAVACFPSRGPCAKQLVAIVAMNDGEASGERKDKDAISIIQNARTAGFAADAAQWLAKWVPSHMVPQVWAVVDSLPLMASGKLDRKKVDSWVAEMPPSVYDNLRGLAAQASSNTPATLAERQIQELCASILNRTPDQVPLAKSFLSSVLRAESIQAIAQVAKPIKGATTAETLKAEHIDCPFDLSPIQKLHVSAYPEGENHYNQSMALRLRGDVNTALLPDAMTAVVERHSMLRARFTRADDGHWSQRITNDAQSSFKHNHYKIDSIGEMGHPAQCLEESLDIRAGPMLQSAVFEISGRTDPILFLVAHHLVIDLVSWRIILDDLTTLLTSSTVLRPSPLPFQTWNSALDAHLGHASTPVPFAEHVMEPATLSDYWGIENEDNTFANASRETFTLPTALTSSLLGPCNEAFSTETMDILLSSLVFSFCQTFNDRPSPMVYNERHGREGWSQALDASETVGWFTTLEPFHLDVDLQSGLLRNLINTKDTRRAMKSRGLQNFRSLVDTALSASPVVEVLVNFLGQSGPLDVTDSIFRPLGHAPQWADVSMTAKRDSMFDIEVGVVEGQLQVRFLFSKHIRPLDGVQQWISAYRGALEGLVAELQASTFTYTPSDFPLAKVSYDAIQSVISHIIPSKDVSSLRNVEDVYPCSAIQQGMLLSQGRSSGLYRFHLVCKLAPRLGGEVDLHKLQKAWAQVLARHAALRTILVDTTDSASTFHQVVLREIQPEIEVLQCDPNDPAFLSQSISKPSLRAVESLPHHLRICRTGEGETLINLEMSHVLTDGNSMTIILEDLLLAYDGKLSTEGPQYGDYIAFLNSQDPSISMEFWKDYLRDVTPTCLSFPAAGEVPPGSFEVHPVPCDMSMEQLSAFSQANGVTIPNLLRLAWALVLRAYTANDEVCFGYLASGRDAPVEGVSRIAGPLINMLISRLCLAGDATVMETLHAVQEDYAKTLPHQYSSLVEVHHALRDRLRGSVLFNTIMSIQRKEDTVGSKDSPYSLDLTPLEGNDPTEYDVVVGIDLTPTEVLVNLTHQTDKLSSLQAGYVGTTFTQILRQLITDPGAPIERLNILPPAHEEQLASWNGDPTPAVEACVHTTFKAWAEQRPDAAAVCAADGSYSYGELNSVSQKLALLLRDRFCVGPEVLVPLCFAKSSWMPVAMAAVLKAGGGNVPLDPSHPRARKQEILADIGATFVITSAENAHLFDGLVPALVLDQGLIDSLDPVPAIYTICPEVKPHNMAFIVFTSGSTGRPKGVVLEHRSISTSCAAHGSVLGVGPESRVLQFASYIFDISIQDHWTTLTRGGCICIPTEEERMNDIAGAVRRMNANWMFLTPTVASLVNPVEIPSIKTLTLAGEAVTQNNLDQWSEAVRLNICWGPAEVSIHCSWNGPVQPQSNPANIGKRLASRIWVTQAQDPNHQVPIGCVGEACVEGPLLAREYLHDAEKTSKSFVTNPAFMKVEPSDPPRRMYRTGDLVRYNTDGNLTFVGRRDHQVKLNGQRLELEEIEFHLRTHEAVGQALVLVPASGSAAKRLVAVVAPLHHAAESDTAPLQLLDREEVMRCNAESSRFKDHLSALVPGYMVPSVWAIVNKMPLGPTGKLFRKEVAQWVDTLDITSLQNHRRSAQSKQELVGPYAELLKGLLSSILGINADEVAGDSHFFRLGGDSLLAIKLAAAVRGRGLSMTVADIFHSPILADLCLSIQVMDRSKEEVPYKPFSFYPAADAESMLHDVQSAYELRRESIEDILPCTPLQEGFMALSLKNMPYVANHVYAFPEDVDVASFMAAWAQTYQDVPILRTRLCETDASGVVQVVVRGPLEWHTIHAESAIDDSVGDAIHRMSLMDLGASLARVGLIQTAGKPSHFVMTIHHALFDGWSLPLVFEHAIKHYDSFRQTSKAAVDHVLRVNFHEFIKSINGLDREAASKFWIKQLDLPEMPRFPACEIKPGVYPLADDFVDQELGIVTPDPNQAATLPNLLRGIWALLVASHTGSQHALFAETLAGRNIPIDTIDCLAAPTITTIPVALPVDMNLTSRQYFSRIQSCYAETIPYEHFGLPAISSLNSQTRRACDLRNLLIIQVGRSQPVVAWERVENATPENGFLTYPLALECHVNTDAPTLLRFSYDSALLSRSEVESLADQFQTIFDRVSAGDCHLCDLVSLQDDERLGSVVRSNTDATHNQPSHGMVRDTTTLDLENEGLGRVRTELKALWNKILGIDTESIDNHTSFFDLGGDSVKSMRLVGAARKTGMAITVSQIFQNPTVDEMAMVVSAVPAAASAAATYKPFSAVAPSVDIREVVDRTHHIRSNPQAVVEDVYAATDYQDWAISLGHRRSRGYINYFRLDFDTRGSADAMRAACQRLADHHPILRTAFSGWQDQTFQVVFRPAPVEFQAVARYECIEESADVVQDVIDRDLARALPLGEVPTRFLFVQRSAHASTLVVRLSHAQYDGFSLPCLLRDLRAAYEGRTLSAPPPFSSFVSHIRDRARDPGAAALWAAYLRGSRMTEVVGRRAPSTGDVLNRTVSRHVPAPSLLAGTTFATALKTCWGLTLSQLSRSTDVVFGFITSGRAAAVPGIESIVGPCLNIIPVRVRSDTGDLQSMLQDMRSHEMASLPHETFGFRSIINHCTDWPRWKRFSSVVQHQNLDDPIDGSIPFAGATGEVGNHLPPHEGADVWVWSFPQADGTLKIDLQYSSSTMETNVAATMLDTLCSYLKLSATDSSRLSTLPQADASTPVVVPSTTMPDEQNEPATENTKFSSRAVALTAAAWRALLGVPPPTSPEATTTTNSEPPTSSYPSPTTVASAASVGSPSKLPSSDSDAGLSDSQTDFFSLGGDHAPMTAISVSGISTPLTEVTNLSSPAEPSTARFGKGTPVGTGGPGKTTPASKAAAVPPESNVSLWAMLQSLGLSLDPDVSFFALCTSATAEVQLSALFKDQGLSLEVEDVVAQPTIRAQAAMVEAMLN
ncbi:uncharacterized protein PG986_013872 [Apiospora aurea]|uniref:Carrier domain-containing protein n=1 Tax=Apiospora aurea TaxID=335848 RepID=A0ABR1PWV1_9PEZI